MDGHHPLYGNVPGDRLVMQSHGSSSTLYQGTTKPVLGPLKAFESPQQPQQRPFLQPKPPPSQYQLQPVPTTRQGPNQATVPATAQHHPPRPMMPAAERLSMQVPQHMAPGVPMASRQDLVQFLRFVQTGDIMTLPTPTLNFNYDKEPQPVAQQQRQSQTPQQSQSTSGSQPQPQTHARHPSLQRPPSHPPRDSAAPGAPGQHPVDRYPPPVHPNHPLPPPILPLQAGPAVPHPKAPANPYPAYHHPAMPASAPNPSSLPPPPVPQLMHARPPVPSELGRQGSHSHRGSISVTGGQPAPPVPNSTAAPVAAAPAGSTSTSMATTTATAIAAPNPFSTMAAATTGKQSHLVHEAMIAALTPVQTGVEQLWALAVNNFRSVLEKMHAGFVDAIQTERATAFAFKTELEKQQAENARLQDKIGNLEKELKEAKEALVNCSGAMVTAQQETARLAGEKGGLEIKLKSMEVVQRRLASQGSRNSFSSSSTSASTSSEPAARTTTNFSLMEIVQKEVSEQVEFKLQAAFRDVQQQRAMREQAERKMQGMMRKVKASLADLDVDVDDRSLMGMDVGPLAPPSRETSTAVGTPPPTFQPPSRKPSMDVLASSMEPSPFCNFNRSLIPTSTSPTLLKSTPSIERRESVPVGSTTATSTSTPPPPLTAQSSLPTPPSSAAALPSSAQGFSLPRCSSPTAHGGPRVLQNADDDHYDRDDGRDGSRKGTASPRSLSQTHCGGPTGLSIRHASVSASGANDDGSGPGGTPLGSGTHTKAETKTVTTNRAASLGVGLGVGRGSSTGPSQSSQPPSRASSCSLPPAVVAGVKRPRSATDSFKLPSSSTISASTSVLAPEREEGEEEEEGTGEPPAVRRRVSVDVSIGQQVDTDDQVVAKDESDLDQLMDDSSDDTLNDDSDHHNYRSSPIPPNPNTNDGDAEMLEEGEVEEERSSSPWHPTAPSSPVPVPKGPSNASGVMEQQQRNKSSTVHAPPVRTSRPYPFKRLSEHSSSSSSQPPQAQPASANPTKGANPTPLSVNTASSSRLNPPVPPPSSTTTPSVGSAPRSSNGDRFHSRPESYAISSSLPSSNSTAPSVAPVPRSGGSSYRPEFYPPSASSSSQAQRPPQSSTSAHPATLSSSSQSATVEHPPIAVKTESELAAASSSTSKGSSQGTGKLGVKHWDLLYIDEGNKWRCRLCLTFAKQLAKDNANKNPNQQILLPRVAFSKDTNSEVMFEHSLKEHPVACEELVRCSAARLFEMKARLH